MNTTKRTTYARIGVRYYVIYDPFQFLSKETLRVYLLDAMEFHLLGEPIWFREIGLGLMLWECRYKDADGKWLRWFDGSGTPVPTGAEHANNAEARAERLAEQLPQLGVEPK